ncbi:MAG: LLM class flavin-dependent oxidoreductase [Thaumarchaeota archaeon]|nr:LLM class flavin-dependent oxidoreductase [Nitrososphaerota archaeon]
MLSLRIGSAIDPMPVDSTAKTAKFLESCGFSSVWLSDETIVFNSPPEMVVPELFPTLAMVASSTKKTKIGTAVIDASIRHPAKTAQSVATVDSIAGGRLLIGIGGGEVGNREPFGIPMDHPFGRMEESVKVMKLLFRATYKNPVSFSGRFYSLKDAYLKIRPVQEGGPPIIVSGFGPRALRLAGELGDGWLSFAHTPESYRETLRGPIAAAARNAGRSLKGFEATIVVPVCISKDRTKVVKTMGGIAKDWLVWSPDNMKLIAPNAVQPLVRQPYAKRNEPASIRALAKLAARISDEVALKMTVSGSADDCVEQLSAFVRSGVSHAVFYIVAIDKPWTMAAREVSEKILPHFDLGRDEPLTNRART